MPVPKDSQREVRAHYLVGPCADLPFAIVAAALMVRELAKLRGRQE